MIKLIFTKMKLQLENIRNNKSTRASYQKEGLPDAW